MRAFLPTPKMIIEARSQSKSLPLGIEILLFLAVFCVAGLIIEGTLQVVIVIPGILISPTFQEVMNQISHGATNFSYQSVMNIVGEILSNPWIMLGMLFSTIGLTAGVLIFCRGIEQRSFASMGLRRAHMLREYLLGAAVGLVLLTSIMGICVVVGALQFEGIATISIGFIAIIVAFLIGFLLQGFSEELLCRGYFMISLARHQSLLVAVVVSSLAFSCLHLMNPGVFEQPLAIPNIFLFGAFAGIYMLKRGDIWGAAAIHSFLNFAQGNIFGAQVSGIVKLPSLIYLEAPPSTVAPWASWINGGAFGLEGGLAVTFVLAIANAILLFLPQKAAAGLAVKQES